MLKVVKKLWLNLLECEAIKAKGMMSCWHRQILSRILYFLFFEKTILFFSSLFVSLLMNTLVCSKS